MSSEIEKILSSPPAPIPIAEETCVDVAGGWSSRISFLFGSDQFPHLASKGRVVDAKSAFQEAVPLVKEQARGILAQGIRNSSIPRPDLRTEISVPALSSRPYVSLYRMVHNGLVPGAITSSFNRVSDKLSMARQMTTEGATERPICYAGRPDSLEKCIELAGLVFQGQLRCGQEIPQENGVYQLQFAINSSLTTIPGSSEYKLTKKEYDILKQFNGQTISLKDPSGTLRHVKCKVIFFAKQFNFCTSLEKTLGASTSGKKVSDVLSANGEEIRQFLGAERASRPEISQLLHILTSYVLSTEEELFCRILLFKRAGIPLVVHCKSCVDRTSLAVAMAYALDQWETSGQLLPALPYKILQNEQYKELFFAHLSTGAMMPFYSRAGKDFNDGFGFKWQIKWAGKPLCCTQNPSMLAMMPERLKKLAFTSLFQMAILPGGALLGFRNISKHFRAWITAKDQIDHHRAFVVFCRVLGLIPLMVKCLTETILFFLFNPKLAKTLYHFSPEKILPPSTRLNGRPLLSAGEA